MQKTFSFFNKFWLPTLLLFPSMILLVIFFIYPIVNMFYNSFHEINPFKKTSEFIELKNYFSIVNDSVFLKSFYNTIVYVFSVTTILIPLSFLVAVLVECCSMMGSFVRGVLYLPSIIAMSVAALMWRFILAFDIGIISQIIGNFGITMPNLLGDARYTMITVVGLSIWRTLGRNTLLFIAGLKSIPREQLEAAEVDGSTPLLSITKIIIPNIWYVISFVTITTIMDCFQAFSIIQVLTQGGPNNSTNMLIYKIWQEGFRFFNFGNASIMTLLI